MTQTTTTPSDTAEGSVELDADLLESEREFREAAVARETELLGRVMKLHADREDAMDFCVITPSIARSWLAKNGSNRRLKPRVIKRIAADIATGLWQRNGDAIRFDKDGNLIDGQHRLYALLRAAEENPRADLYITSYVVVGLPPEAADTIDTGSARSLADTLKIHGHHGNSNLSKALNTAFMWANGTIQDGRKISPTKAQIIAKDGFLDQNPWVEEYLTKMAFLADCEDFKFPIGPAVVLGHEFDQINAEKAAEFWTILTTGASKDMMVISDPTHPVVSLRTKLRKELPRRGSGAKMYHAEIMALTVKAWNHFCAGTAVKSLYFRQVGRTRETFPAIVKD